MNKLEQFIDDDFKARSILIGNLNTNMQNIQNQLQSPQNYRKFFWTPDLNVYGFASNNEMRSKMDQWKDRENKYKTKKLKIKSNGYDGNAQQLNENSISGGNDYDNFLFATHLKDQTSKNDTNPYSQPQPPFHQQDPNQKINQQIYDDDDNM